MARSQATRVYPMACGFPFIVQNRLLTATSKKLKAQDKVPPWLAGYPFNNVSHAICDCWKVKPEPAVVKTPVYSTVPASHLSGMLDPWTRPFYNRLIKRTMPNAQLLVMKDRAHGAGFDQFVDAFLIDPDKKLKKSR